MEQNSLDLQTQLAQLEIAVSIAVHALGIRDEVILKLEDSRRRTLGDGVTAAAFTLLKTLQEARAHG